jgi:hypothetical protein
LGDKEFAPQNPSNSILSVDTYQENWKKTLSQLQFTTLPQLRQRINALPKLVNPCELQDDIDGSVHERIIEIQSGLDENLDQILSIVAGIEESLVALPPPPDDKHLRESKRFMRTGASFQLQMLDDELRWIFDSGADTMEELQKSTPATSSTSHPICRSYRVREITMYTATATKSIDELMKWITSHEFINIQERWVLETSDYDSKIAKLTQFIHQTINSTEPKDDGQVSDDFANLNKNAIPLAQSLIPIIKLSRLFFTKLAKEGPNKILLKPFTDMNTVQLRTLAESPGDINCDFTRIVRYIKESHAYDEADTTRVITQAIKQLIQSFDSNLLLVFLYIIPLVPNSISSPDHLHHSLVTWNDLFSMATQNCLRAAQSYGAP